jgi:hypothetical protein
VREQLAAEFGYDLKAIFADLRNRQAAIGDRMVHQPTTAKPAEGTEEKQSQISSCSEVARRCPAWQPTAIQDWLAKGNA